MSEEGKEETFAYEPPSTRALKYFQGTVDANIYLCFNDTIRVIKETSVDMLKNAFVDSGIDDNLIKIYVSSDFKITQELLDRVEDAETRSQYQPFDMSNNTLCENCYGIVEGHHRIAALKKYNMEFPEQRYPVIVGCLLYHFPDDFASQICKFSYAAMSNSIKERQVHATFPDKLTLIAKLIMVHNKFGKALKSGDDGEDEEKKTETRERNKILRQKRDVGEGVGRGRGVRKKKPLEPWEVDIRVAYCPAGSKTADDTVRKWISATKCLYSESMAFVLADEGAPGSAGMSRNLWVEYVIYSKVLTKNTHNILNVLMYPPAVYESKSASETERYARCTRAYTIGPTETLQNLVRS